MTDQLVNDDVKKLKGIRAEIPRVLEEAFDSNPKGAALALFDCTVAEVRVKPNDAVERGQVLLVLNPKRKNIASRAVKVSAVSNTHEALNDVQPNNKKRKVVEKWENKLRATGSKKIKEVLVTVGMEVKQLQPLIYFEPEAKEEKRFNPLGLTESMLDALDSIPDEDCRKLDGVPFRFPPV